MSDNKFITLLLCLVFTLILAIEGHSVSRIGLDKTFIKEGRFYVLLFNPQRIVTPIENKYSRVIDYSYMSYFQSFDIAYTASYSDWRVAKRREKEKYGFTLSTVEKDLKSTVDGMFYSLKQRVGNSVKINWVKDIKYNNFPGKEVEFEFYSAHEKYLVKCRFYIVNHQTYSLTNVFPQKYIGLTQFQKFLNSFEIK